MCRGASGCAELDTNPANWSHKSTLEPPKAFKAVFSIVDEAINLIERKELSIATSILTVDLEKDCKRWFIEHAQMSGIHRNRILGIKKAKSLHIDLDPIASVNKFQDAVFERDGYICGYCGLKLLNVKTLRRLQNALGKDVFSTSGKSNEERHGFIYVARATADHIYPHNRGGRTNMDNLITSCWSCNYGKGGFTLQELGLDNPLK